MLTILTKPFAKLLEIIGAGVILFGRFLKMPFLWLRATFQTKRGRIRWVLFSIILLAVFTGLLDYPNFYNDLTDKINPQISKYKIQLPKYPVKSFHLGLDLVGGTQLLYDADTSKIPDAERSAALEGVRDVIERRVNAFGVAEPVIQTDKSGDQWRVLVELAGIDNVNDAIKQIGETPLLEFKEQDPNAGQPPQLTPEQQAKISTSEKIALANAKNALRRLKAGESFEKLASELSEDPGSKTKGGDIGFVTRDSIVPEFGDVLFDKLSNGQTTSEPVKTQFGYHLIQRQEDKKNDTGKQEVRARHILFRVLTAQDLVPRDANEGWLNTALSGKQLASSAVAFNQQTNEPHVQLNFNDEGSKLFEEITRRNVGKPVGIFLDKTPISIPTVNEAIVGGQAVITGNFTVDEAKLLAQRLNAGALPVPITLVSQQTVGARLGNVAIQDSLRAGLYGFLLVALFMIGYYRLPGLLAVLALVVYTSISLTVFKMWPVTLTLAGVTGFILSVGMAVDANILIFERLKEELRSGRPLNSSIEIGFARAWTSIRDSNASSLITCAILYWFGTSVVRGFALTLAIGIVVSMFSAIVVTRTFLRIISTEKTSSWIWLYGGKRKSKLNTIV